MPEVWLFGILVATTLLAFTVAGAAGFGGGVIMLPVLVWAFGPKDAIPILTVSTLLAAVSRTGLNWRDISWPVVTWHSLGAIPIAVLASFLFVFAPPAVLTRVLGGVLLLLVLFQHTNLGRSGTLGLRKFVFVGAGTSLVGGFLGGAGVIQAPFLLSYGLTRMAFVGTGAITALLLQVTKLAVFGTTDLLNTQNVLAGVALGVVGFAGSYVGRWVANSASERAFRIIVETLLVIGGILLLITG